MTMNVRYIVTDMDEAVEFYQDHLGFEIQMRPGPGFAALTKDGGRLLLNVPGAGGAGIAGGEPVPGGWNRLQLEVDDLDTIEQRLRSAGVSFRGERVTGQGGDQILVEDPSGNPVELFQPAR